MFLFVLSINCGTMNSQCFTIFYTTQGLSSMSELNFSKRTVAILRNAAKINPAICLELGTRIRTADAAQSILVEAEIDETIPTNFPISDLSGFLSVLELPAFAECTLSMDEKKVKMVGKKTEMTFWAGAHSLVELPEGELELPEGEIKTVIGEEDFKNFNRACGFLKHEYCRLANEGGKVTLTALTPSVDTSNNYVLELGVTTAVDASVIMKTEMLKKLIEGDYQIEASADANYARFSTTDDRLKYVIGCELP